MPQLADNPRTTTKAAIKRASARARASNNRLDREALSRLDQVYRQAAKDIQGTIRQYADAGGIVRLESLQDLLAQVNQRLDRLSQVRNQMLEADLLDAAVLGIRPFEGAAGAAGSLGGIPDDAVRFVQNFVSKEDGLQLSDRLWRLDNGAREKVSAEIQRAVIQGKSASQAANDFISRGEPVPSEVAAKISAANTVGIETAAASALLISDDNVRAHAMRVFRTEINRAHGEAYRAAAFQHPDVIGTRYLLSPNHPAPDICDMHARVNRYGLGPGVYPKGKSPWPAHPNTLSYEEVVFSDEISAEDREGKEDRITWLKTQPPHIQEGVLNSRKKRAALQRGILKESEIATPWRVLKKRYIRKGVDVDNLTVKSALQLPRNAVAGSIADIRTEALQYVVDKGERNKWEYAVAFDINTGEEFIRKTSRRANAVSFTAQEISSLADRRNKIELVHNHPSSFSLSPADLTVATLPGVRNIVAIGHDGTIYSARSIGTAGIINDVHKIVKKEVKEELINQIKTRRLTIGSAELLNAHIINVTLDRLQMISYQVNSSSPGFKKAVKELGNDEIQKIAIKSHDSVVERYLDK